MRVRTSLVSAAEHRAVQGLLSLALTVPLVATAGQYWGSGFWRQTTGVAILFWPGAAWKWTVQANATAVMLVIAALYIAGIVRLLRDRTLAAVLAAGIGGILVAQTAATVVNHFTGWKDHQALGSMNAAGIVNRLILAQWHNPIWEEVVFRGLPLLAYTWLVKRWPTAVKWGYFILPALAMSAYHVPGHGYSRFVDTFLLALVFEWLALRYSFWSVLVLHCVLDAVSVLGVGKMKGVSVGEARWLVEHFHALNTTFTLAMLAAMALTVLQALWLGLAGRAARIEQRAAAQT